MSSRNLFHPIQVGRLTLQHRIVHAPLTRLRTTPDGAPLPGVVEEYYAQRASTPGTLLIAEGTGINERMGGFPGIPGIWSEEQIAAWKKVADAVHAKGSFIFIQIAAVGRVASPSALKEIDPSFDLIGPSDIPSVSSNNGNPRQMTIDEIKSSIQQFSLAATNAVEKAGFDGVEIHGAMGYLVDQFLQDVSNQRTDVYGGSVENRSRFALEVVDAVANVIGEERTAIRLSPWNTFQDMGMKDPKPQFSHLITALKKQHPRLAYVHVVEPRVRGSEDLDLSVFESQSNDFIRDLWKPLKLVSAGGYNVNSAMEATEKGANELIAFGRHFLSNPDLPRRYEHGLPLNVYDRSTFYIRGDASGKGYTDYPFAN